MNPVFAVTSAIVAASAPVDVASVQAGLDALPAPAAVYLSGACIAQPLTVASNKPAPVDERSPLRIASVTKTFTAATILRLWEQGVLDLDEPVSGLTSAGLLDPLTAAGYDFDRITVRHLLNHTSGLYDHASDARYQQMWFDQPDHQWTRAEQIALSARWSGPLHPPGTRFAYADTGYIILGDIIENVTNRPLHEAVREQLKFDALDLHETWWEVVEKPPHGVEGKAPQSLRGQPTDHLHGSLDVYGGGGLIMSARDMATFFQAMFEDRIFDHPRTLSEMTRPMPHEGGDRYRLGIMAHTPQGDWRSQGFWHSGFWGTVVYYIPAKRLAVAAVTSDQAAYAELNTMVQDLIAKIPCEW